MPVPLRYQSTWCVELFPARLCLLNDPLSPKLPGLDCWQVSLWSEAPPGKLQRDTLCKTCLTPKLNSERELVFVAGSLVGLNLGTQSSPGVTGAYVAPLMRV